MNGYEECGTKLMVVSTTLQSKHDPVGVAGDFNQQYQVVIGNKRWLKANGFSLNGDVTDDIISDNEGSGKTVILVGINGNI